MWLAQMLWALYSTSKLKCYDFTAFVLSFIQSSKVLSDFETEIVDVMYFIRSLSTLITQFLDIQSLTGEDSLKMNTASALENILSDVKESTCQWVGIKYNSILVKLYNWVIYNLETPVWLSYVFTTTVSSMNLCIVV